MFSQLNQSFFVGDVCEYGAALLTVLNDEIIAHFWHFFCVLNFTKARLFAASTERDDWDKLRSSLQLLNKLGAEQVETLLIEKHKLEYITVEALIDLLRDCEQVLRESFVASFCHFLS